MNSLTWFIYVVVTSEESKEIFGDLKELLKQQLKQAKGE